MYGELPEPSFPPAWSFSSCFGHAKLARRAVPVVASKGGPRLWIFEAWLPVRAGCHVTVWVMRAAASAVLSCWAMGSISRALSCFQDRCACVSAVAHQASSMLRVLVR